MTKKKINDVDLLLSKLDREQIENFIRKECSHDVQFQERFLALGAGTVFRPNSDIYASRVEDLIEDYGGRHGYIKYRDTFDFNRDVTRILDEADEAMKEGYWEVAIAVLTGIASVAEDILNSGDDSAGELGAIVSECFEKWHRLSSEENLPESIKTEIFNLALTRFNEKNLKDWDWRWDWMEMAINLADTPEKQTEVLKALDAITPNDDDDDWGSRYDANTAQKYKLEMMSRCGSAEDQIKFMYDNVANSDFRKKLIQMAWDKADYDEVLRLAKDGVNNDSNHARLVSDWNKWQYRVYRKIGDRENELKLARHFFFKRGCFGEREFSTASMYKVLKSLIPQNEWSNYVETLISEAISKQDDYNILYIYTEEKMWSAYMDYLRNNPSTYNIDDAPNEVRMLFRDEIVSLYASAVNGFFKHASDRKSYCEGVGLLRNLIEYGGQKEANKIVKEQISRTPRRPALIDELSKL